MGKIFCIMGKSACGKDTVFKGLLDENIEGLETIVPYTTRPIRDGETEGMEYHFVSEKELREMTKAGKVIEVRTYNTVHGLWSYFTADDGQVDLSKHNYVVIGTLEAFGLLASYYGNDRVVPIYIELDDGERLSRALSRERAQDNPKYQELCRRFLADDQDFSEDKLFKAGITNRFTNEESKETVKVIRSFIETMM